MILRRDKVYRLPVLPKVKFTGFHSSDGKIGYTGSILRRPAKNALVYFHYAFFYGIDEFGTAWFVELNTDGVVCITYRDFLQDARRLEFYFLNPNDDYHSAILQRANERVGIPYDARTNNCEHHVNYSVFGKLESIQTKRTETFADALVSGLEIYSRLNPEYNGILPIYSGLREHLKLPRKKEVEEALERMGAHNAAQSIVVIEEILTKYPNVTSTVRNQKVTYYFKARRFSVIDRKKKCLEVRIQKNNGDPINNTMAVNIAPPQMRGKGWVVVDVAKENRHSCLRLIKESYEFISSPSK